MAIQSREEGTVYQSLREADAILDDPVRTRDTCKAARCELRDITL